MRPGEIANSVVLADTETLRPLGVDVAGMVSLEDGLRQTIPWYREHLADL
jgi:hypothetical protein